MYKKSNATLPLCEQIDINLRWNNTQKSLKLTVVF